MYMLSSFNVVLWIFTIIALCITTITITEGFTYPATSNIIPSQYPSSIKSGIYSIHKKSKYHQQHQFLLHLGIDPNVITTSQGLGIRLEPLLLIQQSIYMKPASEHVLQSFWGGKIDPYLSAGKSIRPSTKALSDMGVTLPDPSSLIDPSITTTATAITTIDSKFIIDSNNIQIENVLPGFTPTGSILSHHTNIDQISPPSVVSFVATIDWASSFINIIDKLPMAVLVYAMIEFFILRPNIDTYKEDIEDNRIGIVTDTIAVSTIRLSMFFIVALVTVGIFG
jgi:hypothetical protein